MLQNENLHAKIGFATAENGSSKILHKNSVLTFGMRIRRKKQQVGARLALPPEVVLRQRAEDGAGRVLEEAQRRVAGQGRLEVLSVFRNLAER